MPQTGRAQIGPVMRTIVQKTTPISAVVTAIASEMLSRRNKYQIEAQKLTKNRRNAVHAEIGVVFCTIVLITGPIWARPVWGIWWTWDARLTSTLLMWLIYISYLILRRFSTGGQTPLLAAALAVFGFADVPFVYLSIRYFRTQHPQPVIGGGGSLHPAMWHALLYNWLAVSAPAALLCWFRYQLERKQRDVEETLALESLLEGSPK